MKKQTNKQFAVKFLKLVVAGKIDQAYQKYVNLKGKHHNLFFPKGFSALLKAMKENHEKFPRKKLKIKNVLSDGEMVAVHSHLILNPGEAGMIVVHLFRYKNKKIVEMWDCGQSIPADLLNDDGVF